MRAIARSTRGLTVTHGYLRMPDDLGAHRSEHRRLRPPKQWVLPGALALRAAEAIAPARLLMFHGPWTQHWTGRLGTALVT